MIIAEFMGCTTSPLVFVLHTFTGVRLIVTLGYYQNGRLAIAYINWHQHHRPSSNVWWRCLLYWKWKHFAICVHLWSTLGCSPYDRPKCALDILVSGIIIAASFYLEPAAASGITSNKSWLFCFCRQNYIQPMF